MPDTQASPNTDDKISALEALVLDLAQQVKAVVSQRTRADSAAKADEDEDDDKRDDAAERADEKAKKDAARDALFGNKRKDAKRNDEDDDEDDDKKEEKKDAAKADEDEDEDEDDKKKRDDNDDEPEPMASDDRRKDRQKADAKGDEARDDEARDDRAHDSPKRAHFRGDEDKDEDKDKEDRKDASRADSKRIASLEAQLAQLQRSTRRPRPQTDDELNALAERQQEWDRVAQMHGQRASRPLDGERIESYDRRSAKQFQKHSKKWATTDLSAMPIEVVTAVIAPEIRADAIAAAYQVEPTTGGMLREIRRPDRTGRIISEFVGPVDAPNGALAPFRMPSAAVRRINTQPNQY